MLSVAILAAGKGTRMKSALPKVLHKISGKSLLQRVIDSCDELKPDQIFVITGHKSKEVQKSIPNDKKSILSFKNLNQEPVMLSRYFVEKSKIMKATFWYLTEMYHSLGLVL